MVMVSVLKKPDCWHKVVVVDTHSLSGCETTYELTKKLHRCRLILHNTKHDSQLNMASK